VGGDRYTRAATLSLFAAGLLCFSAFAVYPSYVGLDTTDFVTHRTFRAVSEEWYRWTLAGQAPFPYQWRMLGAWLVRAIESITHRDPHTIDVCLRVLTLATSAAALLVASLDTVGAALALASLGFYFALTAGAFASQGYDMYYTNDYLMVAAWFWVAVLVSRGRYAGAAVVTFAGAWAKETMVLAVVLVAFRAWRGNATTRDLVMVGVAYAIPTIILRLVYRAPLSHWAWWHMLAENVPLLRPDRAALVLALRNNAKVLLFYNVLWAAAGAAVLRTKNAMTRDLAATLALYLVLAYVVVNIRELRHFLPFAILLLPNGLAEMEKSLRMMAPPFITNFTR
jgi:hypothetical protein